MPRIELVPVEDLPPELRKGLDTAVADGWLASSRAPRAFANSPEQMRAMTAVYGANAGHGGGLLSHRLRELIRIRSAQLAGCEECRAARYDDSVTEETVECMLAGAGEELDEREQFVMRFVYLMHVDHHSIDEQFYRDMHELFSTPEIVEIGLATGRLLGSHRFLHTLDLLGDSTPVLPYEPERVAVTPIA